METKRTVFSSIKENEILFTENQGDEIKEYYNSGDVLVYNRFSKKKEFYCNAFGNSFCCSINKELSGTSKKYLQIEEENKKDKSLSKEEITEKTKREYSQYCRGELIRITGKGKEKEEKVKWVDKISYNHNERKVFFPHM